MKPHDAFKHTSKLLFGQEIGELDDFKDYLGEFVLPYQKRKSFISGKDVMISHDFYPSSAKFISHEEMDALNSKFKPLETKDIKDIDSLLSAISERVVFCGNKVLGNCANVQNVDNCVDCSDVLEAHNVFHVRSSAYTSYVREAEHVFGVGVHPLIKYSMRCLEGLNVNRCFECFYSSNLNDCYYTFNCTGSADCIFTFNQRSARRMIGNVQLSKEKYADLKGKLLSEIADELRRKKGIFSIADLVNNDITSGGSIETAVECAPGKVPAKVEDAFRKTTSIVLGTELQNIDAYGPWLSERILKIRKVQGAFGTPTYKVDGLPVVCRISAKKLVTADEAIKLGAKKIELKESESPSLSEIMSRASPIAFFTFEFVDGYHEDAVDVPTIFVGTSIYHLWDSTNSKNCGYTSAAIESSFMFGGYLRILETHFSINCFDSTRLKSCFECDSSYSLTSSYFCHNSENLDNCMFCFNEKSKRYAIAGTEVGREEFMRIRKILLDYLSKELVSKKKTWLSIFSTKGFSFALQSEKFKPLA